MKDDGNRSGGSSVARWWNDLLALYHELKVCRFSLIVAVVGAMIFLGVPQGVELLRSLGEESTFNVLGSGPSAGIKWLGIILGALSWSLASWYTCRVLLCFSFSSGQESDKMPGPLWEWLGPRLRTHLPRLLGIAPMLIMAFGFWHASATYDGASAGAARWLRSYAGFCVFVAGGLYLFFVYRPLKAAVPAAARRAGNKSGIRALDGSTQTALAVTTLFSTVLLLVFTINPILFAGKMGGSAVILFAAACWVFWGGAAVYVAGKYRIPILTLALLWIALCSLWNDNHVVRTLPPSAIARQKVGEAFKAWHSNVAKYPQPVHPLFIVATEGGGIRAAYWTATVLGELEDRCANAHLPDFAEHLFAISAVSGGSLGSAAFDAALAGEHEGAITQKLRKMLGEDYLAPPLAALLFPDMMQRFWPLPLVALDRGQWLERAWENGGRRYLGTDRFAQNFNDLWAHPNPHVGYLPALFLNGTSVESGQRIIASNLVIDNGFLDSVDAATKVAVGDNRNCDVPLSTAAHGSARFTYVSPAGRFRDGTHIVDGGYFENSGSTTALEILRAVEKAILNQGIADVRPYIILISNDPLSAPSGGRDLKLTTPTVKLEQNKHRPRSFLEDALAPVWALANSRGAHDSYAQLALREGQGYQNVVYFGLSPSPVPLPLGWKLSGTAAEEMIRQTQMSGAQIDGKDNPEAFKEILNLLNGSTTISAFGQQDLLNLGRP
jgi:hypothetical protein